MKQNFLRIFEIIILLCIGSIFGILLSKNVYKEHYSSLYSKEESSTYTIDTSSRNLAMMLETGEGTGEYALSSSSTWPDESEYTFNATASRCENGSTLTWDSDAKAVVMSGNVSDKCYVYFDVAEAVKPVITSATLIYTCGDNSNSVYIDELTLENDLNITSYVLSLTNICFETAE